MARRKDPTGALGEIIRRQRELSELSMRQFASLAGISNPYLSQIERGLRAPSERVVESIARNLRTSAEALYEQAGIAEDDEGESGEVADSHTLTAIRADQRLSARQRRALEEVYAAFVGQGGAAARKPSR